MTNEIDRGEPPYLQIARHYRELIESGELRAGHGLPSVREMAQHWNVAHTTAARALKTLQSEGLATSTPGAGTVVSRQGTGPRTAEELAAHLRATGDFYPPGYQSTILDAEIIRAPEQVANALGVELDQPVIRRRRVTCDDSGEPIEASASYIRGEFAGLAPALLEAQPIPNGVLGYLEAESGKKAETGCDQYGAWPADAESAAALNLPVGTPVLVERHWWTANDGTVLEYSESTEPGDRWRTHRYQIGDQSP
ncbi:MAG: GntR family transcriptional regulator [Pseudonocardiales bacterium]|nr:MAG: GntR family transcriptional regulator [Pseudonocardiales bacterium]